MIQHMRGQSDRAVGLPSFLNFFGPFTWTLLLIVGAYSVEASEEMRGVWIVRHVLKDPEHIRKAVETAKQAGLNAVFVQVRGRGDAYYQSSLVPPAENLPTGKERFDPLALTISLAHQAGLEVHAWVNVYLSWLPTETAPRAANHVFNQHPEWFMASADGIDMGRLNLGGKNLVRRGVEGRFLSPGIPAVRQHLVRVYEEIIDRYNVDGLHLDYVRYPNSHYDFNQIPRGLFRKRYRFDPKNLQQTATDLKPDLKARIWKRWRTDQVTALVEEVHRMIQQKKPWVKLSVAVKPDFNKAYHEFGQDWIRWINKEMVDFVVPMLYALKMDIFTLRVQEARKYVKKGHLYAGIGIYLHNTTTETVAQIRRTRSLGAKGVVLFSYDSLLEKPNLVDRLKRETFSWPSKVPRMGWKQDRYGRKPEAR